jgi:hypothetical protein
LGCPTCRPSGRCESWANSESSTRTIASPRQNSKKIDPPLEKAERRGRPGRPLGCKITSASTQRFNQPAGGIVALAGPPQIDVPTREACALQHPLRLWGPGLPQTPGPSARPAMSSMPLAVIDRPRHFEGFRTPRYWAARGSSDYQSVLLTPHLRRTRSSSDRVARCRLAGLQRAT